jgi:hypothetical protein
MTFSAWINRSLRDDDFLPQFWAFSLDMPDIVNGSSKLDPASNTDLHPTLVPRLLGLGNGYDQQLYMASAWDDMVVATLHNSVGDFVVAFSIEDTYNSSITSTPASTPAFESAAANQRMWRLPHQVSSIDPMGQ